MRFRIDFCDIYWLEGGWVGYLVDYCFDVRKEKLEKIGTIFFR